MRASGPRTVVFHPVALPHLMVLLTLLIAAGCHETDSTDDSSAGQFACPSCNLVLISLDTLRADHVSAYGYPQETTPFIDRWAEDAIFFERAFATAPKTAESHMSVFTGLYTTAHHVFTFAKAGLARPDQILKLNDRIPTLPEILKESGYRTVGFHGGGNVAAKFGFGRGFDLYERADIGSLIGEKRVLRFVDSMSATPDQKFFLFVHSYHVHAPYTPEVLPSRAAAYGGRIEHDKKKLRNMVASGRCESVAKCFWSGVDESSPADARHLEALYDAEITELDAKVEELLQRLAALPRETLVVLIGDHGEEFLEHGAFEHNQVYNEILRVPLIIKHPRLEEGIRVGSRVSLVDLLPTLLEVLGIDRGVNVQGASFLPLIATDRASRAIFAEYPPFALYTLIASDKKLILQGFPSRDISSYHKVELYDLRSDPAEKKNLADGDSDLQEMFERLTERVFESQALRSAIQQGELPVTESLEGETLEQLEALGYVE